MISFIKKGISSNLVALLLSTYIIISCMYIYCPDLIIPVSLLIFAIQALVFSFYDYLSKKSMLLRFVSVLGSFFAIIGMVIIAVRTGQNKSGYDYFIWFLSPQALVSFSTSYIVATFIIINFFISSTVYYFSAVRYRLSMTFLITLIPFAFYRKEGASVPAAVAFILLILYIILMIHCRNINTRPDQKMIVDKGYKKSIFYFLAAASAVSFVIPKPDTNFAAAVWLSSVLDSEKFSDYMLERLGITSTTSSSFTIYSNPTNTHLYTFTSDELPLNLRAQTFSIYDFSKNSWSVIPEDVQGKNLCDSDAVLLDPGKFYNVISEAAEKDSSFAEKYGLDGIKRTIPYDSSRKLSMTYSAKKNSKYYLSPTLGYNVRNTEEKDVFRAGNGMLYNRTDVGLVYHLVYYSGKLAEYEDYHKVLKSLNNVNYEEFLNDLAELSGNNEQYQSVINAYYEDFRYAQEYYRKNSGGATPKIASLAEKITKDIDSDYEKAVAIQDYFVNNNFVYDLNYQKPVNYDIETFLFDDRSGVCGDFATAMTIMARSAGIPARYAEGVHLNEAENGIVSVTDADLHAFPELFIPGYGWMTFEPTRIPLAEKNWFLRLAFNGIIVLCTLLLIIFVIIFYIFYLPEVSEKIFDMKIRKKTNEEAVRMIGMRVRQKMSAKDGASSEDVSDMVNNIYGFDVSDIFREYDSVVYGNNKTDTDVYQSVYKKYHDLIVCKNEFEKRNRKKWKFRKD